jgi:hypothetical protein
MTIYGNYYFKFDDIWKISETGDLEFIYWVMDSGGDFVCEVKAMLGNGNKITFPAFYLSPFDLKHGNLDAFVNFVVTNLTLSRLAADLSHYLSKPLLNISTGTPRKAA